jgi:hypothetical protein
LIVGVKKGTRWNQMESDGTRIYKDQERPKLSVAEDVPHLFHSQIQNTGLFVEEEAVALFVLMF